MTDIYSKLEQIKKVFDVEKITDINPDKSYIQKYYLANRLAYTIFQSSKGYIHMGISRDGIFKLEDLIEPAKFVNKYVSKLEQTANILELASGRAANSLYLAKQNPRSAFNAIDLSDGQLKYAYQNAKTVNNLKVIKGDYHDLSQFEDSTFDICFIVEALCYSINKEKVLTEVYRILKKDGVFIVIDGYLNKDESELNSDILLANRLVEVGMAVPKFELYNSFLNNAKKYYTVEYQEDISKAVLPSMLRLERWARAFLKYTFLAKLLLRILPKMIVYNSLSGYLMPNLIQDKIANYMITVLKK